MEVQNLSSSATIKSKLWKTNTKKQMKTTENLDNGKSYYQFDEILSERTIFTVPEFKEVGQKSVIASPKFSKSHQNNKEKGQANNTIDRKCFQKTLPKSDILELLKGHPICKEFRV